MTTFATNLAKFAINPYSNRLPITKPSQFYGRGKELEEVAQKLYNGEIACLSGEPRIGKTSLLYYLTHPKGAWQRAEFTTFLGESEDYLFVLIELLRLPVRQGTAFWRYVFDRLIEEIKKADVETSDIKKWYEESQSSLDDYEIRTNFEKCLKRISRHVVLLFDDFDILIGTFDINEVLQVTDALKTLQASPDLEGKLNYVIVTLDPLAYLYNSRNIESFSRLGSANSPLDPLNLLEPAAVNEIIEKPLEQAGIQKDLFTETDLAFILRLAGRHPDLLKIACFYTYQARRQGEADYSRFQQIIEGDAAVKSLLSSLWERVKQADIYLELPLSATTISLAQGRQYVDERALYELQMRGLVDIACSEPCLFGELFRRFVLSKQDKEVPGSNEVPSIILTELEARLYHHLSLHMEQPCTREELLRAVWGEKPPASRDALEQIVKRLRQKIESDPKQPAYLQSIRGQGYQLRRGEYERRVAPS